MELQGRELKPGMTGEDVRLLQTELGKLGYNIPLEEQGTFGTRTSLMVEQFQAAHGLDAMDGVDQATAARIKIGNLLRTGAVKSGATGAAFEVELPLGKTRLQTWLAEPGGVLRGAYYTEVEYLGPVVKPKEEATEKEPTKTAPKKTRRPGAY